GRVEECPDLGETLEIGHRPHLDPRTARGRVSLLRRIEQATPCLLPAHPSRSRLSPSSDSTSPSRSAVRSGMCCTSTCSSSPWAPPPTAPRPSSVGTPSPAVKLPSEAPPTPTAVSGALPSP